MSATAVAVRDRPILFSSEMVRAILDGTKSQTRRVLNPQPDSSLNAYKARVVDRFKAVGVTVKTGRASFEAGNFAGPINAFRDGKDGVKAEIDCPFGAVGGRLWVREAWNIGRPAITTGANAGMGFIPKLHLKEGTMTVTEYRDAHEDYKLAYAATWDGPDLPPWRPSMHMPRWASRITLEITNVRVERLQDITAADCIAEGIPSRGIDRDGPNIASAIMYISDYEALWDSINADRAPWSSNPWVWCISFRRVTV